MSDRRPQPVSGSLLVCARVGMLAMGISMGTACSQSIQPVETPEAAIAAARVAWRSIGDKALSGQEYFTPETIARFEPYTATLDDGVWTVRGTRPASYSGSMLLTIVRADTGSVSVGMIADPVSSK